VRSGGRQRSAVAQSASARADATLLALLVDALPLLRSGLTSETADRVAELLLKRLDVDAVSIVERESVLARRGAGAAQHHVGDQLRSALTRGVMENGRTGVANSARAVGCSVPRCPHTAAVVAPLVVRGRTLGALKLYRIGGRPIGATVVHVCEGLARIFGVYLELADLEAQASRVVEAELEACRAQASPHFLFNTLNAIAALTRSDAQRAHDTLIEFADFFRETLRGHGDVWTLDEELAYVRRYVDLQRLRLGERLRFEARVAPAARGVLVPVLVVQPLVENAIVHGLEPKAGGGRLQVTAARSDGLVVVTVADEGVGIAPERLPDVIGRGYGTGLGIGLSNVDRRLRGMFGPDFGLRIVSDPGHGTSVTLRVPASSHA
jgi:two-component system LytT family sensor kinase